MNSVIVLNTLREHFSTTYIIIIFLLLPVSSIMMELFSKVPSFTNPNSLSLMAWILGTGIDGSEIRSGVLQLVFVRPLTRSEYVWSKYFALLSIVFSFSFAMWIATCISFLFLKSEFIFQTAFTNLADHLIFAVGIAAVIVLFSCLLKGHGDIGLAVLLYLMVPVLSQTGRYFSFDLLVRASVELERFLNPSFSVRMFESGIWWFAIFSYFSTITLCLTLAIILLNRKELSYAE
jgi:ABC-type transport system involved in multi-copper enzyme maturation permease subunit